MNKIKFKFIVSKWANYYFFVQNLSCWHYSNIEIYNKKWQEILPIFSKNEKQLLASFAKIRKTEPDSNSIFEKAFYSTNDPIKKLSSKLPSRDMEVIIKTFDALENKFNMIWNSEEPKLNRWKNVLESFNESPTYDEIRKELEVFYNEKIKKEKVLKCFLNIAPISHSGSVVTNNVITQELSSLALDHVNKIIGTIWHEIIHAYFDKHYFKELVNEFTQDEDARRKLKEITASSLLPLGCLGYKYLGLKKTDNIYWKYNINPSKTHQIISHSEEYVENKIVVDNKYLEKITHTLVK